MKRLILYLCAAALLTSAAYAQSPKSKNTNKDANKAAAPVANSADNSPGKAAGPFTDDAYVIGPEDVLTVFVWKEPELTQTLAVRPDGKISLPLLNDMPASGMTTLQLKENIISGLKKFISEPTVTVIVQQARSQKASIIGEVTHPGTYLINGPTTLVNFISLAGGFRDFAATDRISIIRQENGQTKKLKFNYRDFAKGKNLDQNIPLRPGDIVVVP
jgi:polysaccharide export outer membrane protein